MARRKRTVEAIIGKLREELRGCSFVPAGDGVSIERRGTKSRHRSQLLGRSLPGDVVVEANLITPTKEAVPYSGFRHAGDETIRVLVGAFHAATPTGACLFRKTDSANS